MDVTEDKSSIFFSATPCLQLDVAILTTSTHQTLFSSHRDVEMRLEQSKTDVRDGFLQLLRLKAATPKAAAADDSRNRYLHDAADAADAAGTILGGC